METKWDSVIVGGGPAGMSAAIYMSRFMRDTLVIDSEDGRWTYGQLTENYLGFPGGVRAHELREKGKSQAERFGAKIKNGYVEALEKREEEFVLCLEGGEHLDAKTVIWASGVKDIWPTNISREHVGIFLFWCIVCDGWRSQKKPTLIVVNETSDADTVLQFLTYTDSITVVPEISSLVSPEFREKILHPSIKFIDSSIDDVITDGDSLTSVKLLNGEIIETRIIFSLLGNTPRTALLTHLGVNLNNKGHIEINDKNHTSLLGFYAAGDVTSLHGHQVASAVHQGAMAAQAANHYLFTHYE